MKNRVKTHPEGLLSEEFTKISKSDIAFDNSMETLISWLQTAKSYDFLNEKEINDIFREEIKHAVIMSV